MKLAIADPPYPPLFAERRDAPGADVRVTSRSRARRWYGDGTRGKTDSPPADFHPDAGKWDEISAHRELLEQLLENYDGWAIATTPDGLGAYAPLPISVRVMAWHRPNSIPGGQRLMSVWEPVIVYVPETRRGRGTGERVHDFLSAPGPRRDFAGAKPAVWTRWVLSALGYEPATDTVDDLFPGSGAVAAATDGMLL